MIHATFSKFEGNKCLSFPINYDEGYNFVGQYVYANEERYNDHIQLLKNKFN
jgi:hypothetical protein